MTLAETRPDSPPPPADLVVTAAMIAHVNAPEPRDLFQDGYRCGWHAGLEAGRRAAEAELDRAWAETARKTRAIGLAVSHAELERRRGR